MKRVVLGGILGGIVAFLWMCISWGLLPWHQEGIFKFKDEQAVAKVISDNAPKSGVYVLPYVSMKTFHKTVKHDEAVYKDQKKALRENPLVFAQINTHGEQDFSFFSYLWSVIILCISVGFVAYLLTLLKLDTSYFKRFYFCVIFGFSLSLFAQAPSWIWFGASSSYAGIMIVDTVITWALVGLVLASIVKPKFHLKQMM